MKQEEFEAKAKSASKEMLKKKAPTRPETQFVKGALWAWELLMAVHEYPYYEEILRQDVCDRFNAAEPERWQESLITETAKKMARLDRQERQVAEDGDTLEEYDKNMNKHTVNHPLQITMKELERTIGMQREHLGLTNKSSKKMESPKGKQDSAANALDEFIDGIKG